MLLTTDLYRKKKYLQFPWYIICLLCGELKCHNLTAPLFLAFVSRDCPIWGGGTGSACPSGPPRDQPSRAVSFRGSGLLSSGLAGPEKQRARPSSILFQYNIGSINSVICCCFMPKLGAHIKVKSVVHNTSWSFLTISKLRTCHKTSRTNNPIVYTAIVAWK